MSQLFSKINVASTKRTTIDLSHHQVTTSDFGYILPIAVREMVPNDDFVVKPNVFTRLAPLAVPCYGKIRCRIHHFFVPNRILYPDFESFVSQDLNNNTIPPYFTRSNIWSLLDTDPQYGTNPSASIKRGQYGRLMSNLGINPAIFGVANNAGGLDPSERINALPFLAYYRIWLDYFADSSILDHAQLDRAFKSFVANGGDLSSTAFFPQLLLTRSACFQKDYYTTAKLNPQEGNPSMVGVDIAGADLNPGLNMSSFTPYQVIKGGDNVWQNTTGAQSAATSKIGQFTIEALRAANAAQRYSERNNFVGSKIINRILAHFGIAPTAERLDMAEFIDGSEFPIQIGDVTSTASTSVSGLTETAGLGAQAGKGVGAGHGQCSYHAKEHGIFMSVMSILPDTGYYQALPFPWTRGVYGDPLEYYTPEYENLGYQPVLNKEVFCNTDSSSYTSYDPDGIFGYVPRYADYKFHNDVLAGDFVGKLPSNTPAPLITQMDSWHLFRKFAFTNADPLALNENFVTCTNTNNDFDRIFQVNRTDLDHFYFNIDVDIKATRPMTGFSEPTLDATNTGDGNTISLPYGGTRL